MLSAFRILIKILLPVAVLIVAIYLAKHLIDTAPSQERRSEPPAQPTVEVMIIKPQDYTVVVRSQGTVEPRIQGTLVTEVSGRIVEVSDDFHSGGFFEKGDTLVQIDPEAYQHDLVAVKAELIHAKAAIQEAKSALQDAQVQTELARRDWKRDDSNKSEPPAIAIHLPRLESRKASLASKEAELQATMARIQQAETILERTTIRAPYAGRVLKNQVDAGQFVSAGSSLASIYAVDKVEVRLPLTDIQASFITLPKSYRGETQSVTSTEVLFLVTNNNRVRDTNEFYRWKGGIVRTEGDIDVQSRQQFVIAQIDDPYKRQKDNRPPLKIGQFVQAQIRGQTLSEVVVLPRDLIRGEDEVLVVSKQNAIERRKINILWRDDDEVVLLSGLTAGERVSKTPLTFATNGMLVKIKGEQKKSDSRKIETGSEHKPSSNLMKEDN